MRYVLALFGLLAVAFLYSCERGEDDDNISAQDKVFVNKLAIANRTEIILGSLALAKATDDSIADYAEAMIAAHKTAEGELKTLAEKLAVPITADSLDATGMAMRNTLTSLSGTLFDSAYIWGAVEGHEKAADIVQEEINGGTNALLRNFAAAMLSQIQMHQAAADTIAARY